MGRVSLHMSLFVALAVMHAPAARANDAIKHVDQNGRVIYSDKPIAGAKIIAAVPLVPSRAPSKAPVASERRASITWADGQLQKQHAAGGRALEAARAEVRSAEEELRWSLERLDRLRSPQAWEIEGRFPGGVRVTQEYVDRLQDLELDVAVARARLEYAQGTLDKVK